MTKLRATLAPPGHSTLGGWDPYPTTSRPPYELLPSFSWELIQEDMLLLDLLMGAYDRLPNWTLPCAILENSSTVSKKIQPLTANSRRYNDPTKIGPLLGIRIFRVTVPFTVRGCELTVK
jgi:hypothetical protein